MNHRSDCDCKRDGIFHFIAQKCHATCVIEYHEYTFQHAVFEMPLGRKKFCLSCQWMNKKCLHDKPCKHATMMIDSISIFFQLVPFLFFYSCFEHRILFLTLFLIFVTLHEHPLFRKLPLLVNLFLESTFNLRIQFRFFLMHILILSYSLSLDFPDSGGKCENLNMSSFSTKLSAVPDGFESHYGSCRMEPKYLLTSSINCDASGLICSEGGRVCSDHVYDMPLRPEAHMAIGGEVKIICFSARSLHQ